MLVKLLPQYMGVFIEIRVFSNKSGFNPCYFWKASKFRVNVALILLRIKA